MKHDDIEIGTHYAVGRSLKEGPLRVVVTATGLGESGRVVRVRPVRRGDGQDIGAEEVEQHADCIWGTWEKRVHLFDPYSSLAALDNETLR